MYVGGYIETFKIHLNVSLALGFVAPFFGILAAIISKQFPWMRLGRWKLWWLNAFVCAIIAAFLAIGTSAVILTLIRSNPTQAPSETVLNASMSILGFGIAVATAWGAIFGTWFALRFDKYFVESI